MKYKGVIVILLLLVISSISNNQIAAMNQSHIFSTKNIKESPAIIQKLNMFNGEKIGLNEFPSGYSATFRNVNMDGLIVRNTTTVYLHNVTVEAIYVFDEGVVYAEDSNITDLLYMSDNSSFISVNTQISTATCYGNALFNATGSKADVYKFYGYSKAYIANQEIARITEFHDYSYGFLKNVVFDDNFDFEMKNNANVHIENFVFGSSSAFFSSDQSTADLFNGENITTLHVALNAYVHLKNVYGVNTIMTEEFGYVLLEDSNITNLNGGYRILNKVFNLTYGNYTPGTGVFSYDALGATDIANLNIQYLWAENSTINIRDAMTDLDVWIEASDVYVSNLTGGQTEIHNSNSTITSFLSGEYSFYGGSVTLIDIYYNASSPSSLSMEIDTVEHLNITNSQFPNLKIIDSIGYLKNVYIADTLELPLESNLIAKNVSVGLLSGGLRIYEPAYLNATYQEVQNDNYDIIGIDNASEVNAAWINVKFAYAYNTDVLVENLYDISQRIYIYIYNSTLTVRNVTMDMYAYAYDGSYVSYTKYISYYGALYMYDSNATIRYTDTMGGSYNALYVYSFRSRVNINDSKILSFYARDYSKVNLYNVTTTYDSDLVGNSQLNAVNCPHLWNMVITQNSNATINGTTLNMITVYDLAYANIYNSFIAYLYNATYIQGDASVIGSQITGDYTFTANLVNTTVTMHTYRYIYAYGGNLSILNATIDVIKAYNFANITVKNSEINNIRLYDYSNTYMENTTYFTMYMYDNTKLSGKYNHLGHTALYYDSELNLMQSYNKSSSTYEIELYQQSKANLSNVLINYIRLYGNSSLVASNVSDGISLITINARDYSKVTLLPSIADEVSFFKEVTTYDQAALTIDNSVVEKLSVYSSEKAIVNRTTITDLNVNTDTNITIINSDITNMHLYIFADTGVSGNITLQHVGITNGDTMYIVGCYAELSSTMDPDNYTLFIKGDYFIHNVENKLLYAKDKAVLNVYNMTLSFVLLEINTDYSPPTILSSHNTYLFEKGMTAQNISWLVNDINPWKLEIYINGTYNHTVEWSHKTMNYSLGLDDFSVGFYIITIKAIDLLKNEAEAQTSVTVYPSTPPEFTSTPSDVTIEHGAGNPTLSWIAYDLFPYQYYVYINDTVQYGGYWESNIPINFTLVNPNVGTYNVTMEITDKVGNIVRDSALIIVEESLPPQIVLRPDDTIEAQENSSVTLRWIAKDASPANYEIRINGSVVATGDWHNNENIVYTIFNIQPGTHNVTITFYDQAGNKAVDQVTIHVAHETTGGGENQPLSPMLIAGAIVALLALIILIVVAVRKKRG
ncbi:MAG: hypothetical protein ACP6IP_06445 [Candidatus Njordarchaeia archaeon]